MSDDLTTPTVETPEPEPVAPEADTLRQEIEAERAALKKKESELNKWSMTLAERERTYQPVQTPTPDVVPDLDPEAQKVLDAYFEKKYGGVEKAVSALYADTVEAEMERFAVAKGIEPDALKQTLIEQNIQPAEMSLKGIRKSFETAKAIMDASKFNPDAEREKLKAEILADLTERGVRIEGVEPKTKTPTKGVDLDDDALTPAERYAAFKERE